MGNTTNHPVCVTIQAAISLDEDIRKRVDWALSRHMVTITMLYWLTPYRKAGYIILPEEMILEETDDEFRWEQAVWFYNKGLASLFKLTFA